MNNQLILKSLKVYANNGNVAYFEKFHSGINIIRGDNSSGKSTISHFIFYVLGGAFNSWVDEALECDTVYGEVTLNGVVATLKREISESSNQPMYIFWGQMDEAAKIVEPGQWTKYPYSASDNKKSFSNVLFENLNIPIVYGDANITMHQILRLLYVDQDSPTNSLFLYEQFDSALTRNTIAELLLGIYSEELYNNRLEKRSKSKDLEKLEGEIKGMLQLSDNPILLQPSHLKTMIDNLRLNKDSISEQIEALKTKEKKVIYTSNTKLEFQNLQEESLKLRLQTESITERIFSLEYEISDTDFFIEMLESKILSIKNSLRTKEKLVTIPLTFCPECLSSLQNTVASNCGLCKQPLDDKMENSALSKMKQEISFQIIESRKIRSRQFQEVLDLKAKHERIKQDLQTSQKAVNMALKDVKSIRDEKIDRLLVEKGEIDGQILQFTTMLETAMKFQQFNEKALQLKADLNNLNLIIHYQELAQGEQAKDTSTKIENFALKLLHEDLNREEGFREANTLKIDYGSNSIYVDDRLKRFSASSNFYLKNTVRFALFFASLESKEMRFPRFILCDNMEDNGIEEERAKNFQRLILKTAHDYSKANYQIIYTTSFIPEELEGSIYCVGDYYSEEGNNKSLKNIN
tara:strand:- start:76 stop:1983 length:1908 start_codon:yes stop_codon:yes gene_type:complete